MGNSLWEINAGLIHVETLFGKCVHFNLGPASTRISSFFFFSFFFFLFIACVSVCLCCSNKISGLNFLEGGS